MRAPATIDRGYLPFGIPYLQRGGWSCFPTTLDVHAAINIDVMKTRHVLAMISTNLGTEVVYDNVM